MNESANQWPNMCENVYRLRFGQWNYTWALKKLGLKVIIFAVWIAPRVWSGDLSQRKTESERMSDYTGREFVLCTNLNANARTKINQAEFSCVSVTLRKLDVWTIYMRFVGKQQKAAAKRKKRKRNLRLLFTKSEIAQISSLTTWNYNVK